MVKKIDPMKNVAATVLTAQDLLSKSADGAIERAEPFADPLIGGISVKGFGAFGFRRGDREFLSEFNRKLAEFIGTPEHLALVRPFGFSAETLPGNISADDIVNR